MFASEHDFTAWLMKDVIEKAGGIIMPMVASAYQPAGYPDRYIAHPLFDGWLECKKDNRLLTGDQRAWMIKLCVRGVAAFEVRYASDTDEIRIGFPVGGNGRVYGLSCTTIQHVNDGGGLFVLRLLRQAREQMKKLIQTGDWQCESPPATDDDVPF